MNGCIDYWMDLINKKAVTIRKLLYMRYVRNKTLQDPLLLENNQLWDDNGIGDFPLIAHSIMFYSLFI